MFSTELTEGWSLKKEKKGMGLGIYFFGPDHQSMA